MHNQLRTLLRDASGESSFVIATNIDIRGFSSFFSDSSQAAAYLSSAYTRVLDDYFNDVSFFKPTGDGLLLVRVVDRDSLKVATTEVVESALRLNSEFASVCAADELINFPTPSRVGIGIARGTATRIVAKKKTLDFSGYPLNLCSRLMDLARPSGVVVSDGVGLTLVPETVQQQFKDESVYIRGLADTAGMTVHVTSDVVIPDANRKPFGAELFTETTERITFKDLKGRAKLYLHRLSKEPSNNGSVKMEVVFPAVGTGGKPHPHMYRTLSFEPSEVDQRTDGLFACFDYERIATVLSNVKVKPSWDVKLTVHYNVAIGTSSKS